MSPGPGTAFDKTLELEVPEIQEGIVRLAVAREPGVLKLRLTANMKMLTCGRLRTWAQMIVRELWVRRSMSSLAT